MTKREAVVVNGQTGRVEVRLAFTAGNADTLVAGRAWGRRVDFRCEQRVAWCGTGVVLSILVAAVSLQAAAARHALPRTPVVAPAPAMAIQAGRLESLAPGILLVASRDLTDPNFAQTVVVLLDHDDDGTLGLVVNRQTDVPLSRVFDKLPQGQSQAVPVYVGGPVAMTSVQGLVRSQKSIPQARHVSDDLYVIRTRDPLETRLRGTPDPLNFRVYLGYAGWAPGQLAGEVTVGAWHIFPANIDAVFDGDPATLWDRKIRETEVLLAGSTDPDRRLSWAP